MIKYIETHLVDHCNLNCRGCSHFSPLVGKPFYKDINEFKKEFEQLSKITNKQIQKIRLMGGEPFLHPQILDFCIYTREYFPSSEIVIVSNGILLHQLKEEDINKYNELNIKLCVSNYHINIDEEKFNKFKLHEYEEKNEMYNIGLDLQGGRRIDYEFYNCDHVDYGCYFLKDGRIYQCAISAQIDYFNKYFNTNIKYDLDDISIDIFTHTENEIKQFLSTPHSFCQYCNVDIRYTSLQPHALSKKEITEWTFQ